jgi:hypothetical protein
MSSRCRFDKWEIIVGKRIKQTIKHSARNFF